MAEKEQTPESTGEESAEPAYVSDQLALKVWSVLARDLHEGGSVILLEKAWDKTNEGFVVFPIYEGQDPEEIKPDVWMSWRHELKPPMAGHTRIRDYAEVVEAYSVSSLTKLRAIESEHGLTHVEAARRFQVDEPGLVALVLRVWHLPRSYRYENVAELGPDAGFAPLPFDVELTELTPAVEDEDFERRLAPIKSALG